MGGDTLLDAYRRVDRLLEARARDYPRRTEPTWSELLAEVEALAARLRAQADIVPAGHDRDGPVAAALADTPIFVVGHRKTGTTLVLDLLDGHPQLVCLPGESNHFLHFLPRVAALDPAARAAQAQAWWLLRLVTPSGLPPFWAAGPFDAEPDPYAVFTRELLRLAAELPQRDLLGLAAVALDAARSGTSGGSPARRAWVEKTPGHEHCLERILRVYPRARFVHVLRDPRSVAAAIARLDRAAGQETDLLDVALGIRRSFAAARRNRRILGERRYHLLRYEDLVARPQEAMRRVAGFADIGWSPSLLVPTVGGVEATSNSAWPGRRVTGAIEARQLELWRQELDERAAALVSAVTARAARPFGYRLPAGGRMRALARVGARRARYELGTRRRGLARAIGAAGGGTAARGFPG